MKDEFGLKQSVAVKNANKKAYISKKKQKKNLAPLPEHKDNDALGAFRPSRHKHRKTHASPLDKKETIVYKERHKVGTRVYVDRGNNSWGEAGIYQGKVDGVPKILLDSGEVIYGNQCFWKVIENPTLINEQNQQSQQKAGKVKSKHRAKPKHFTYYKNARKR